jgi:hypothetical protein
LAGDAAGRAHGETYDRVGSGSGSGGFGAAGRGAAAGGVGRTGSGTGAGGAGRAGRVGVTGGAGAGLAGVREPGVEMRRGLGRMEADMPAGYRHDGRGA